MSVNSWSALTPRVCHRNGRECLLYGLLHYWARDLSASWLERPQDRANFNILRDISQSLSDLAMMVQLFLHPV